MGSTQHLENPVEALLADHVPDADDFGVGSGNTDGKITLSNLEYEVLLLLALDHSSFDGLDESGTVVRVDDGLSDLENHVSSAPFATPRLPRLEIVLRRVSPRHRRSGDRQLALTRQRCAPAAQGDSTVDLHQTRHEPVARPAPVGRVRRSTAAMDRI